MDNCLFTHDELRFICQVFENVPLNGPAAQVAPVIDTMRGIVSKCLVELAKEPESGEATAQAEQVQLEQVEGGAPAVAKRRRSGAKAEA